MTSRSGFESAAALNMRQRSGSAAVRASSLNMPSQSGLASAGGLAASSAVAAGASNTEAESSEEIQGDETDQTSIKNPWNLYQHRHRRLGLTSTTLSKMYRSEKSKT